MFENTIIYCCIQFANKSSRFACIDPTVYYKIQYEIVLFSAETLCDHIERTEWGEGGRKLLGDAE